MKPAHPLDRPIWSALTTRQAHLAQGDEHALRFAPDYAMFAAAADGSEASLAALAALADCEAGIAVVEADPGPDPPGAVAATRARVNQMVLRALPPGEVGFAFEALTDDDAPQMLALATLTRPGPFFVRTHRLGDFIGVKRDGRLVAMAGERMKPDGFTEVSGVCTHPDHRGHGYAAGLSRIVTARIVARGETPFLHVYASNTGAIGLYETLGFALRRELTITVLTGPAAPG